MATATKSETRQLIRIDEALERETGALGAISDEAHGMLAKAAGDIDRALKLARGIIAIRNAITPKILSEVIQPLMNTPLGFITDRGMPRSREKDPYDVGVIKECAVVALINGFRLTGNEWNIIAGSCYGAKNGWRRKLEEVPGISDIKVSPGVPSLHQASGQMVCRVALSWRLNGKLDMLIGTDGKPGLAFPLITYGKESPDQLIGKATAKALRAAFIQASGSTCTVEAEDAGEPVASKTGPGLPEGTTRTEQVTSMLKDNAAASKPASTEEKDALRKQADEVGVTEMALEAKLNELGESWSSLKSGQAKEISEWLTSFEPSIGGK